MPERFHCYRCDKTRNREAFTWRHDGSRFSACRECNREMARERRARLAKGKPAKHPEFSPTGKPAKKGPADA